MRFQAVSAVHVTDGMLGDDGSEKVITSIRGEGGNRRSADAVIAGT